MKRIAPHLTCLRSTFSNVWLLKNPADGKRILIDTGHALDRIPLLSIFWKEGIRMPGDLTAVLLTHRHHDHAGNAAWIRKRYGAPVFCHESDAAILRGDKSAPPHKRGSVPFYKDFFRGIEDDRPAFTDVDETFTEGSWKWGFRITSVPGHTEGSVMIHHEPTATLFSGDSIIVKKNLVEMLSRDSTPRMQLADPHYCDDPEVAQRSIRRYLQNLPPTEILCPGHGPAVDEQTQQKLKKLLVSTDRVRFLPDEGRP